MSKEQRVDELINQWNAYRSGEAEPARYMTLKGDLYNARNGKGAYPANLIDPDDEVMASVEHYFLCRAWVGNGTYPAWQVKAMVILYDTGKMVGVTPRHNPGKPVTPISVMQIKYQSRGTADGERDLALSGKSAPTLPQAPPKYF